VSQSLALLVLAAGATVFSANARADIPPPKPATFWAEHQAPSKLHVIIAGASLSAAIVAVGLLVARRPGLKPAARKTTQIALGIALLTIVIPTAAVPLWIAWEDRQWYRWHQDNDARLRRNQSLRYELLKKRDNELMKQRQKPNVETRDSAADRLQIP
jgi:hypothetical protein